MKYTTTIQQEKKIKKTTKFDIGDVVQTYWWRWDINIFKIWYIRISWDSIYYFDRLECDEWIYEDNLTLVSKSK